MKARFLLFLERFRSSYWFVPSLMLAGSAALAFALIAMDERIDTEQLRGLWWIFSGSAEGARSLLSTVAGSVIAVASTTFSITIAVLSLTSSQFGPRLLRGFLRDTMNQMVLGTFLGTFLYCLLVLRTVRSVEESYFVPHIAVTVGVASAITSVCMLVFLIHHVTQAVQISNIIDVAAQDLNSGIDRLFPDQIGTGDPAPAADTAGEEESAEREINASRRQRAQPIRSESSGYIQAIDGDALLSLAEDSDSLIWLNHRPGQFVTKGGIIAYMASRENGTPAEGDGDAPANINRAIAIGSQRTATQDIEFLIQQLVEVAVRALSPGINDPFTAMMCLDRLGSALIRLSERRMPSSLRRDENGVLRVIAPTLTFSEIVEICLGSIRHYGRADAHVMRHLLGVLGAAATHTLTDEQRDTLSDQTRKTRDAVLKSCPDDDSPSLEDAYRKAMNNLATAPEHEIV